MLKYKGNVINHRLIGMVGFLSQDGKSAAGIRLLYPLNLKKYKYIEI
jgi:hypothetical protein